MDILLVSAFVPLLRRGEGLSFISDSRFSSLESRECEWEREVVYKSSPE